MLQLMLEEGGFVQSTVRSEV